MTDPLFEAHIIIARATARLMAARVTDRELDDLEAATEEVERAIADGNPALIAATNADLHRMEVRTARNEHLLPLAWNIHDQGRRLAYLCFGGEGGVEVDLNTHFERVCTAHRDSVTAARAHDPETAELVAARHVHLFRDRVVEFLQTNGTAVLDGKSQVLPAMSRLRLNTGDRVSIQTRGPLPACESSLPVVDDTASFVVVPRSNGSLSRSRARDPHVRCDRTAPAARHVQIRPAPRRG